MAKVFLGLGSNINPHTNIAQALDSLSELFGGLRLSPVYESEAVGFDGNNFLNLVVELETDLGVAELLASLKSIEAELGRNRNAPRFSSRSMDIDILSYDDWVGDFDGVQLPRDEIVKNAFVLKPFCDLAPDFIHPEFQVKLCELQENESIAKQKLWVTDFYWRGERVSKKDQALAR